MPSGLEPFQLKRENLMSASTSDSKFFYKNGATMFRVTPAQSLMHSSMIKDVLASGREFVVNMDTGMLTIHNEVAFQKQLKEERVAALKEIEAQKASEAAERAQLEMKAESHLQALKRTRAAYDAAVAAASAFEVAVSKALQANDVKVASRFAQTRPMFFIKFHGATGIYDLPRDCDLALEKLETFTNVERCLVYSDQQVSPVNFNVNKTKSEFYDSVRQLYRLSYARFFQNERNQH